MTNHCQQIIVDKSLSTIMDKSNKYHPTASIDHEHPRQVRRNSKYYVVSVLAVMLGISSLVFTARATELHLPGFNMEMKGWPIGYSAW